MPFLRVICPALLMAGFLLTQGCGAHGSYGVSKYEYNKDGTFYAENGKEYDSIKVKYKSNKDGVTEMSYEALGSKAFEGQMIGAEVTKEILKTIKELLPAMMSEAVKGALGTKALDILSMPDTELEE